MIITHASSQKIAEIEDVFEHLLGVLSFAGEGNTYNMAGNCVYQYNLDVENVISTKRFWYEHDTEDAVCAEVIEQLAEALDVDSEVAADLLDETTDTYEVMDAMDAGMAGWTVQQYQGILAHHLGYDCCESFDEQGTLYLAYCVDREMHEVKC